jgi:hypothetical protein
MNWIKFNLPMYLALLMLWWGSSSSSAQEEFVGTSANGVSVELIGIGMHPSADAEWWKPDGSPLAQRPYDKLIPKRRFKRDFMQREVWFKRTGKFENELFWGYRTIPGETEHNGKVFDAAGKEIDGIEATIFSFDTSVRTCTVRFDFTVEESPWKTLIKATVGQTYTDANPEAGVAVGFMRPRQEGSDTVVTVVNTGFGSTRLLAIDKQGIEHVAQRGEPSSEIIIDETIVAEYRIADRLPSDLREWQFQKRKLKSEKIEFHNVALEPGIKTEVMIDVVSAEEDNRVKRIARENELVKQLAVEHGYSLADGESLKYIADADNETRNALHYLIINEQKWANPPNVYPFEAYMLVFKKLPKGKLNWIASREDAPTLADVFEHVLPFKKQQYDCPADVLSAYVPGDWIVSWDPRDHHEFSDTELATFEKILNEQLNLNVKIGWKTVERPTLVITGKYKAAPKSEEGADDSGSYEGSFGLLARRTHIAGTGGTYEDFKLAIGEALMLPVVDEAELRPKSDHFQWLQSGEPIMNSERLPLEQEQLVIESLHEQIGYDFKIEPRKVKLLSIEPANE